jgi:hypothetical protein
VGRQASLDIAASYSKGDVYNKNTQHDAFAGGITALLVGGSYSINDCYSLGDITAEYAGTSGRWVMAGGILGTTSQNNNTVGIRHCYAAGIVKAIFNGTGAGTNLISGGIAGELNNYQENSHLVNNMYLGSSVQAEGPGNRYIRFLYAYGPSTSNTYTGWRWVSAKKYESFSAGGSLSEIFVTNNLDGGAGATSDLNTTWSADLGFISTTWSNYTNNFKGVTRTIQRPLLVNNQETL